MGFVLEKIELKNFRLVKHDTIKFDTSPNHVTGILGDSGSGKSSFLIGLTFALYGSKGYPKGVSAQELRRENIDDKDECFVQAEIIDASGAKLKIKRYIDAKGHQKCELYRDGEKTASATRVGAVDKQILQFINIDFQKYILGCIIGQGQLEMLNSAGEAERKKTIQDLANMGVISEVVSDLRSEKNVAVTAYNKLIEGHLTPEDVSELNEQLERMLKETANFDPNRLDEIEKEIADNRRESEEKSELYYQYSSMSSRRTELESKLRGVEEPKASVGELEAEHTDVQSKMREANSFLATMRERYSTAAKELDSAKAKIVQNGSEIATLKSEIDKAKVATDSQPQLEQELSELQSQMVKANSTMGEVEAMMSGVKGSLEALEAHGDSTHLTLCPTCHQGLSEEVAGRLVSGLKQEMETLLERKNKGVAYIDGLSGKIRSLERNIADARNLSASMNTQTQRKEFLENETATLEAKVTELQSSIETLKADGERAKHDFDSLSAKESELSTQLEVAKNYFSWNNELDEIIEKLQQAKAPSKEELYDLQTVFDALTVEKNVLSGMAKTVQLIPGLQNQVEQANKSSGSTKDALKEKERAVAAEKIIVAFKDDQTNKLHPSVERVMSSIVNIMTSGNYIGVKLSDGWDVNLITAQGVIRSFPKLSGGERAVASLALRLALAAGFADTGLLWLDEILSAMDRDLRATVMGAIRRLKGRQIIMVSHHQDTANYYDATFKMVRSHDGSFSYLEKSGYEGEELTQDDIQDSDQ